MKVPSLVSTALLGAGVASARYAMYADQYHTTTFPNSSMVTGIDHAIMAFMPASDFTSSPHGNFTLFEPLDTFKSRFPTGAKTMIAIGGWGDAGFHDAMANDSMIQLFASNVATMLNLTGLDGVDIDCEYPGGNGADYKTLPNSDLVYEIDAFPKLLAAIRSAIGTSKVLSIAVPGLERDMIAYTNVTVPLITQEIDFMNIMTYDLMNRRDNYTSHHTSINGSLEAVDRYLALGLPAAKANMGIAFYAKYFTIAETNCTNPIGCPTVALENADGTDNGLSGAFTFETIAAVPSNLTTSTDGSCGASTATTCPTGNCCSQYGYCGTTSAHCGLSCQPDYGVCNGTSALTSWRTAQTNGTTDETLGGKYYFDNSASLFWTWDTPSLVTRKFTEIIEMRGLGGIMAWSLAEDSDGWELLAAMRDGVAAGNMSEIAA